MTVDPLLQRIRKVVAELKACSSSRNIQRGKNLHKAAIQCGDDSNIYVANTLISMYARCGCMGEARRVFDYMKTPDVVSWNALILGYADNGAGGMALDLFRRMRIECGPPDSLTFVAAAKACTDLAAAEESNGKLLKVASREKGKSLHMLAWRTGWASQVHLQNTLVDMYANCGSMEDARKVFQSMKRPDVVAWTALMLGYAEIGEARVALDLFLRMRRQGCPPDSRTFIAALKACSSLAVKDERDAKENSRERGNALSLVCWINGFDSEIFLKNTLMDLYAKCGSMVDARRVFESIRHPDAVSWTSLMLGYVDSGEGAVALDLFWRMRREGCTPDSRAFAAALKACGVIGALEIGRGIHADISTSGLQHDVIIPVALLDFYCRCGSLAEAGQVFASSANKDLVTWNAIIAGYSRHGAPAAFDLFDKMRETCIQPDARTFQSVLTACSHAGLVDKGKEYFELMTKLYWIEPDLEHYNCVIDILGRGNKLDDAMALLRSVTLSLNVVTWMTVLGSCRKWKNVKLGELAFHSLVSLDDTNYAGAYSGAYLLMSNLSGRTSDGASFAEA